jgi:hypothetical protein
MTSSARSLRVAAAAAALSALAHAQDALSTDPMDSDAAPRAVAGPGPIDSAAALRALNASVLYSSVATSVSSDVPGIPGVKFSGTTAAFQRPYGTKGGRWLLKADTNAATSADDVLLVDGVVGLREGDQAPWTLATETMGPFEARNGITDNGGLAVKNNTSSSLNDDYVAKFTGGVWSIVAQEAQQIGAFPAGVTYDDTLTSVVLLDGGDVCLEADLIDGVGITTTIDEVFVREGATNTLFAQELVTIPSSQFTGLSETVDNISFDDVWFTPDGANYVMKADLTGATTSDDVIIYNGAVVLQEGFDVPGLPGDPIASAGIDEVAMDFAGNWWARGNLVSTQDYVVRNGVVMAKGGDPIHTGATELWDDTTFGDLFFMHQGDSLGNYVIAGVTDNANTFTNGVLVLNNQTVVCREGDPVDLDGNGLFDDGHFINTFGNDDVLLNDNGELYFVATLRTSNAVTTSVAQVVLRVDLTSTAPVVYCTAGTTTNGCVPSISGTGTPSATAAAGFTLDVANVEGQKQGLFFYGVSGPTASPWGSGGTSFLCVKSPTQRMGAQDSLGTAGLCDGAYSQDWNTYRFNSSPTAVGQPFAAGNTVWAQAWFRDPPAVKTTNLSDGLEFVLQP